MPASYRNLIDTNQLSDAIKGTGTGNIFRTTTNEARYIKGYDSKSLMDLVNDLGLNSDMFNQIFGIDNKKLDDYDPYHTGDAKKEEFEFNSDGEKTDAKEVQRNYDKDTYQYKRTLFDKFGFGDLDFWYEDPIYLGFKIKIEEDTPLFHGYYKSTDNSDNDVLDGDVRKNSLKSFIEKYGIDIPDIANRKDIWSEFSNVLFKIFNSFRLPFTYILIKFYLNRLRWLYFLHLF